MATHQFSVERWSAENLMPPTINLNVRSLLEDRTLKDDCKSETEPNEISAAKIKDMVDQRIREMLGMSLNELKTKLDKIDKIEADVEEVVETIKLAEASEYESSSYFTSDSEDGEDEQYEDEPEKGEVPEIDDEPGIAIENQLKIKELSEKVIEILTSHLLSTVWHGCAKNTYGFFIRIMLLSGSRFKKQLIPDTFDLLPLAFLGVIFSAGMQFLLAWYLWTRLPESSPYINGDNAVLKPYPGTEGKRGVFEDSHPFARSPLPANEYPNYRFANDICRTAPVVQLVCIGLFLFSIFNNVPGIMRNFAIIWASERFVSEDEEGITKLHYWRESGYSREPENDFLLRFCSEYLDVLDVNEDRLQSSAARRSVLVFFCEMYLKGSILKSGKRQANSAQKESSTAPGIEDEATRKTQEDAKLFAGAARRRWMLPVYFPAVTSFAGAACRRLPASPPEPKAQRCTGWRSVMAEDIPRGILEVNETRSFLAEVLRLIDNEASVRPVGTKEVLKSYSDLKTVPDPTLAASLDRLRGTDALRGTEPLREADAMVSEPKKEPIREPIQFCDEVRFNLVRADYLKPHPWLRPYAYRAAKFSKQIEEDNARREAEAEAAANARAEEANDPAAAAAAARRTTRQGVWRLMQGPSAAPSAHSFFALLTKQLGRQFSDLPAAVRLLRFPARMRRFRVLAFLLGVLPEVATLIMIAVAGIPYILWSGFKVDSDTEGMEEIILATLAIVFIYDIDDAVYEHILPELYKQAHERDRFELSRGWISGETARNLKSLKVSAQPRRPCGCGPVQSDSDQNAEKRERKRLRRMARCNPLKWLMKHEAAAGDRQQDAASSQPGGNVGLAAALVYSNGAESNGADRKQVGGLAVDVVMDMKAEDEEEKRILNWMRKQTLDFDKAMEALPMTAERALRMSMSDDWNDLYLARAYPFLYARKLRYALAGHAWERFLDYYGRYGLHYLVLVCISVIIVGGYRHLAHCARFAPTGSSFGIFGTQPWPSTCLLGVGPRADIFAQLNGSTADSFMAVSCGVSGYIPDAGEWERNKDYLTTDARR